VTLLDPSLRIDPVDAAWWADQIEGLTVERLRLRVWEWAEQKRYLPPELTPKPGLWDNSYTPYLVEIMDCLSANHPARKVVLMKGAQVGATTLAENWLGYTIDHNPGGFIYLSADKELTKIGIELKVDRMLHHCGLSHLLSAASAGKTKRSGDTATLKEFPNGFLLAAGARSPGKLRSTSAPNMLLDELDGMPLVLGGIGKEEGSPPGIAEARTRAYESSRKVFYLSTPLKMQTSMIYPLYLLGDQRKYFVPCIHCGHMQPLDWNGFDEKGRHFGITFELDDYGILVPDSVGYECANCHALFYNHDKAWFLDPRNGAEWRPTATTPDGKPRGSMEEGLVSFHLPAFLSPPGMYSWTGSVQKWLKAWDVVNDRPKDIDALQEFYNLDRGLPWEERGETPKAERVELHRRAIYTEGQIPNSYIERETGAPAILLTCAVDVHKDRLDVEVVAWCQDRQTYSVEWLHLQAFDDGGKAIDVSDLSSHGPWQPLREMMENGVWEADDGRQYRIQITVIDMGYGEFSDAVLEFCKGYSAGVVPVMGRSVIPKGSRIQEFSWGETATGQVMVNVNASLYKNRMAGWLKPDWFEHQLQPQGYPNYPNDRGRDFFKQYEAEEKVALMDQRTKQRKGWEWRQIGQRANHAWDCRVYGMAAFDMIVVEVCLGVLELEKLDYLAFFNYATPKRNSRGEWIAGPYSFHPEQVAA
jgi:phage terminase large subunit GpA-like protein